MKRLCLLLQFTAAFLPIEFLFAKDAPRKPQDAAKHMTLPRGFKATLFAGEPDIVQPMAFTFDDRGRLWVVENRSYPGWKGEKKDRVLIFEDTDGDGRFDKCKVFLDNGSNLSGIEVGFGGVWLCSTPNLIFVPDANHDDVPDGPPVVKLNGWDLKAQHNVFNSLTWGPDGWLYGCNGIMSNSRVGKPGTPDSRRTRINCGVWRYHPTREVFEVVAHGTTNPWGLDFDDYGQMFITNCVIKHLFHVVPGARFQRMYGEDFNPHSYALMESCADHIHWAGGHWTEARGGEKHHAAGGGHAHAGAMVYLGDNWPDEYRNHLFTCNIHGNRVNQDILERRGSGYVAHHGKDFLLANDPWFRGLAIKYGPDGGAFVTDWTDTGECHNYQVVDQTNGRIYKITHGKTKPFKGDLAKLSDEELVKLQRHKNDWFVRHARRLLHERHAAGRLGGKVSETLLRWLRKDPDPTRRLRALWAFHVLGKASESLLGEVLADKHEAVRGWGVQLALEKGRPSAALRAKLVARARDERSPWVRLALASGLQRLPVADRWPLAEGLLAHGEDAADHNLSLLIWYGVEPLVPADTGKALDLAKAAKIPLVRRYVARRIAAMGKTEKRSSGLDLLVQRLDRTEDTSFRLELLRGVHEALEGQRRVAMPQGWADLYPRLGKSANAEIRDLTTLLALIFGDDRAYSQLRKITTDTRADAPTRGKAIAALTAAKDPKLPPLLHRLLADRAVSGAALRGLAAYNDSATPQVILKHYSGFSDGDKRDALSTLASRPAYALALLEAIERKKIPRGDVSAFHVHQLQGLKDKRVSKRLATVWGAIRATPADKAARIKKYKAALPAEVLARADLSAGRAVFVRTCATCHTLFDTGASIGPELTGSQRANLDYVLTNIVDPSAVVARDYQVSVIETRNGRVLSGIIKREDDRSLAVQTATDLVVVPKNDIRERQQTAQSLMPEGILESLRANEVRDLLAYLASPHQVPLPVKDMLPDLHLLEPFWKSNTVYRESLLFVRDKDTSPASARLLFAPDRLLAVHSADGRHHYELGKDFKISPDGQGLVLTTHSPIPFLKAAELFPAKGSPRSIGHKTGDPNVNVLFSEGHWFHDRQVEVTYTRKPARWTGYSPAFAAKSLPRTVARLRKRQPVTIAVSGDSISHGYNASGVTKAEPFLPPYPELVVAQLRATYGAKVTLHNRAVSGWSAGQGVKALDNLLKVKPDLVIIAYGMNDVGGREPAGFKANIARMLKRIRAANPHTEVILVASMVGNASWDRTPPALFPKYQDALASLQGPGAAVADLTALWQDLLKRKRFVDVTGNGVNHPNDFGHRLYAQVILALLTDPKRVQMAEGKK
jgi:putative membrane-bound dehydrogenase-like protein